MSAVKKILGVVCAISLIIVCFFSAMDILLYGCKGFIPNEYRKLGVAETVGVSQEDLDVVSTEMMQYLKGQREHLSDIVTTIDGVPNTPFFNERECAHMEDVRTLFLGGMSLRMWCAILCAVIILVLIIWEKKESVHTLAHGMITGTIIFLVAVGALAAWAAGDFNSFWTVFHLLFFTGDSWLFDPSTSRMINMLPEQFFSDTVISIIAIFAAMIAILLTASVIILKKQRKKA